MADYWHNHHGSPCSPNVILQHMGRMADGFVNFVSILKGDLMWLSKIQYSKHPPWLMYSLAMVSMHSKYSRRRIEFQAYLKAFSVYYINSSPVIHLMNGCHGWTYYQFQYNRIPSRTLYRVPRLTFGTCDLRVLNNWRQCFDNIGESKLPKQLALILRSDYALNLRSLTVALILSFMIAQWDV